MRPISWEPVAAGNGAFEHVGGPHGLPYDELLHKRV